VEAVVEVVKVVKVVEVVRRLPKREWRHSEEKREVTKVNIKKVNLLTTLRKWG
jgi:hypothetical protein